MRIAVPKEIMDQEHRIALVPDSVWECVNHGHDVVIESGAGLGVGIQDSAYVEAGGKIGASATEVYQQADMIVKVKEPQQHERAILRSDQLLFSYLHLAPNNEATSELLARHVTSLAFETVTHPNGQGTPLLAPMSQIAGRLAALEGAKLLMIDASTNGTNLGKLAMGVPGVPPAHFVVIGGGVVGENAIQVALGLGAAVTVIDKSGDRLDVLSKRFPTLRTCFANQQKLSELLRTADVAIGAIHVRGAKTGHLVSKAMVAAMPKGSVIIDVCIDQGGCFATSHPTNHSDPTYLQEGVIHYCVANMPGIVPLTASYALSHAITPYVLAVADKGLHGAVDDDPGLAQGLNTYRGMLTNSNVAASQQRDFVAPSEALEKSA